ncbi:MAG: aminoacyl-tRNA hydrolase [Candidatus Magasanikbacteria bacterium CG_4_10_14_0_2_um_filter_37_12]|uniref:Peptidyl-tRNA hydrolase n=1 Tax=Candidatus Magasanikbacteria bacterium CG_4_10_14_0_2_um_filter_37_12 TaxID=1974637 RepID=A0A2M7V6Y5_9BACT|nr:MAG: aminoacyl-tRNA hydrolase [Candidatus Magasanikbacteria bacterium CG_4_10_14_0_2_um_filter_37_12]
MKLVIGLGNPGKQYARTRHNVGFMILDALKKELQEEPKESWKLSKKFNAEIYEVTVNKEKIILAKPMTFMNHSGESVGLISNFYTISPHKIIIAHDDKDLKLGEIKIQNDRGHAGHNGIKSIMEYLGTKDFMRIRIGIASTNDKKMNDTSKFVLGKFGLLEKKELNKMIEKSIEEIKKLL